MAKNVLGTDLECCCTDPMTGFYRNGKCDTGPDDRGQHTVCVEITDDFLEYSKAVGNDLSTAMPQYQFPGLKEGDRWCLCMMRRIQAYQDGVAPRIFLEGTHLSVIEFVDLETLREFSVDS